MTDKTPPHDVATDPVSVPPWRRMLPIALFTAGLVILALYLFSPVLGADTAVVLGDRILGKPDSRADAIAMLQGLSGQTHEVYSAVVLAAAAGRVLDCLNITRVTFAQLDRAWIESYCDTGDPMDKAGAYGVQGRAAEKITRIEGSFSGVMGLPLYETCRLLRQAEVLS
mgnify:CR=1 FL=1